MQSRSQISWFLVNRKEGYPGRARFSQVKALKSRTGSLRSDSSSTRDSPCGFDDIADMAMMPVWQETVDGPYLKVASS